MEGWRDGGNISDQPKSSAEVDASALSLQLLAAAAALSYRCSGSSVQQQLLLLQLLKLLLLQLLKLLQLLQLLKPLQLLHGATAARSSVCTSVSECTVGMQ